MGTGRTLALGAGVIAVATAYWALSGAAATWQYYLTVDECMDQAARIVGSRLRIHGTVGPETLEIDRNQQLARFVLTGERECVQVICTGTLPDNLAEGMEVVVEGYLERRDLVRGHKVMTKCASKYAAQGRT
ncbi:MAG: cytochrome c maturation protein CcmE [Pirellulaceae bacterium]|jgi:cytochrome c-type biogenesis protein CcmE|nr:cytochrome c maturation protein CcmE [Pirellulaceae bacterium]